MAMFSHFLNEQNLEAHVITPAKLVFMSVTAGL